MAQYREKAGAALAKYGGKVEHSSPQVTALDGNPDAPQIAAILSFPDAEGSKGWINDPELARLHDLRRSIGLNSILLLS